MANHTFRFRDVIFDMQVKADAVEGYGGVITWCEPSVDARESTAAAIQQKTGATLVPPYNYGPTICGQGTMALELLEQVPARFGIQYVATLFMHIRSRCFELHASNLRAACDDAGASPGRNHCANLRRGDDFRHFYCRKRH